MKITDKTTPTGGMTEARARELLETSTTAFVWNGTAYLVVKVRDDGEAVDMLRCDGGYPWYFIEHLLHDWRAGRLHFRDAELILRDFVEGEG